jgi:hypothetical protein
MQNDPIKRLTLPQRGIKGVMMAQELRDMRAAEPSGTYRARSETHASGDGEVLPSIRLVQNDNHWLRRSIRH